jgi:NAD+ synthase (glutamine-hydrolysing)
MFGFIRLAAATPQVSVANCTQNAERIISMLQKADEQEVSVVCFPELSVSAATCNDLFFQRSLIEAVKNELCKIAEATSSLNAFGIVGAPLLYNNKLFNCAVVVGEGKIWGVVPKIYLPNHAESSESRWFTSGNVLAEGLNMQIGRSIVPFTANQLFTTADFTFAVSFGSDICAPVSPAISLSFAGADVIFTPAAFVESAGRHKAQRSFLLHQSQSLISGLVCASAGYGESTQDVVLSGKTFIAEMGAMIAECKRFTHAEQLTIGEIDVERIRHARLENSLYKQGAEQNVHTIFLFTELPIEKKNVENLMRTYPSLPFIPTDEAERCERCEEILNIQTEGLMKRLVHTHSDKVVIGISGGLDSTLALLVTVRAFDALGISRNNIYGVTMPGFGTTDRTYTNALEMMKQLGITTYEIPIATAVLQHFADIHHDPSKHDVTYENSQARERTQILMDFANSKGAMVIGTGDLSELALGWATYNGDHMSMYGVNGSVPKTLVKHLVIHEAQESDNEVVRNTLLDVVNTPISPELIPAAEDGTIAQKTENLVGPYELHDFFLYHTLRNAFTPEKICFIAERAFAGTYDKATITHWLNTFTRRFFMQQFKRSCLPDGPKVGSCSLSPRGDWRMPTDADGSHWKFL